VIESIDLTGYYHQRTEGALAWWEGWGYVAPGSARSSVTPTPLVSCRHKAQRIRICLSSGPLWGVSDRCI